GERRVMRAIRGRSAAWGHPRRRTRRWALEMALHSRMPGISLANRAVVVQGFPPPVASSANPAAALLSRGVGWARAPWPEWSGWDLRCEAVGRLAPAMGWEEEWSRIPEPAECRWEAMAPTADRH